MSPRSLVCFFLLAFALSWGLQIAALHDAGDPESAAAVPYLLAAMYTPALVTLLYALRRRDYRAGILWRPTWACLPLGLVACLVPAAIAFGVVALFSATGWGHSGWFSFTRAGVTVGGGPWLLGRGAQSWPVFVANVAATGIVYSALNALAAMGEEIGWRGFIQGHLVQRFGATAGIALLGFLWAMWHLPAQLAGYNFPDHPVLGALVISPLELIAVSFFLGWLTIRARSFIPAALAHGAGNSIQEGTLANLKLDVPRLYEHLATLALTVVVGLACWALVARARPVRAHAD